MSLTPVLPNARVTTAYLRRGAWLWILARLVASAAVLLGSADPLPILLPMWRTGSIGFVLAVILLAYIDVSVRRERALIMNLGFPVGIVAAICAAPALAGEILITVVGVVI